MFYLQKGFTYRNFLMDVLAIFIFIVWFWLLITVFADLFRRHARGGGAVTRTYLKIADRCRSDINAE